MVCPIPYGDHNYCVTSKEAETVWTRLTKHSKDGEKMHAL